MASAAVTGQPSIPMPVMGQSDRMGWGIFHLFATADGAEPVFIAVTSNAHWERFCDALGLADLRDNPQLDSNQKRVAARPWLLPRVREQVAKWSSRDLLARLEGAGVPCAPVLRPGQLLDDPHLLSTTRF